MSIVSNAAWYEPNGREAAERQAAEYRRQGFEVELIEAHDTRSGQLQQRFLRVRG